MSYNNKTIRFIDSEYRELFCIPDGGNIKVTYPIGDGRGTQVRACEFLDETHTKIGGTVYHICEFAERMEALGAKYEPEAQLYGAEILPFTVGEEKYFTYNREEGNTCVGHISGEFGREGDRLFSSWSDRESGRNTSEFQTELHSAVYAFRKNLLKDYDSMLAYCQNHPEALLDGGDTYKRYGFKLETDTRQYFINCFFGENMRDARFIVYAYDKSAPVIEQKRLWDVLPGASDESKMFYNNEKADKCIGYVQGSVIQTQDKAQRRRDKEIISECIDGLGLYAAFRARDNRNSSDIDKARKLVETLVSYWGLNEGESAKTPEDFMWDFDVRVDNAKCGHEVTGDIKKACNSVIYGLHRHGMEMVTAQGDSAMSDILKAGDLIKDVAGYWDFEPYAAAEDMTTKLYAEVRVMLEGVALPGQPVSGRSNAGYEIQQATLFNNDRGFVLAHNPKDPASFVTWQFTYDNGDFSYYWGHYIVSEEWAKVDFMTRVADYTRNYAVTEKPIPTAAVEMDKEANYNMIDELQNNAKVPKPDLTDGQTFDEIRELVPEMLPDDKPSVLEQIRDAQKTSKPTKQKTEREKKSKEPEL